MRWFESILVHHRGLSQDPGNLLMPVEERIGKFLDAVKPDVKYPAQVFFDWHHRLTGSCEAGRRAFAADHGIDLQHGEYTLKEFLDLTKDAFGSDVIREIIDKMEGEKNGSE